MSATITLKNIPDEIYISLKQAAEIHHRSINSEAIACLERVLMPGKTNHEERIIRARQIREELAHYATHAKRFKANEISKVIKEGRA